MYIERSSKASHRPSISGLKHDTLWSVLHSKTEISVWLLSPKRLIHHFPCKPKHIRCHRFPSLYFSFLRLLHQLKTQCFLSEMLLILTLQRADNVVQAAACVEGVFSHQSHSDGSKETISVVTLSSISMRVFEPVWPVRADVSLLITWLISSFRLRVHIISLVHWVIVVPSLILWTSIYSIQCPQNWKKWHFLLGLLNVLYSTTVAIVVL